ncbi:TIGR03767 family metallophosphoesterase [Microbacteriaceae bacterium VKM Ac-2855]|nr:TIGR03767 family metallophosphoesterase [Microbacteriaceae bacterium VKM Ac-2855]
MAGLSRRSFVAGTAALASAWQLEPDVLRARLSADLGATTAAAREVPSTLEQTVLRGSVLSKKYRGLTTGAGEPHLARLDVLGRAPDAGRSANRRSLLYLAHLSDMHVIDAQSPARIEPMIVQDHASWGSAFHPHDPLTVHVTAAMVKAFADLRISPLTGAPMGAAIVTGDSADMHSTHELRWYIDVLDGKEILPNSGSATTFEGVQAWPEASWAYRPANPRGGEFGDYGFPELPELLEDASRIAVQSVGLPVPWFAVYGNHDTLLLGTFDLSPQLHSLALGARKAYTLEATATSILQGYASASSPMQQAIDAMGLQLGFRHGFRSVAADSSRRLFAQYDFMAEHFRTEKTPGPVGHGFTQRNLDSGETWWRTELSPDVRAFGLDTCNQVAGPDGAVPDAQFQWLKTELAQAQKDQKLVLIFSHHNSLTLENRAQRPGEEVVLHHAEEFVDLLLAHPNVIGWLNGHTHLNQILPHITSGSGSAGTGSGFWEITTASCIDFPQQQQLVEIVDNRDGTLSLFTTVVDHAAPTTPSAGSDYLDLAARSREFALNDWAEDPLMRRGSPLDRNTELLVAAPFDLARITDASVQARQAADHARLLAYEQRAVQ